jgi:hypothetical protein
MAFNSVLKKISDAKDRIVELGITSNEKIVALLEEYKHAISALTAFGLRVGKLRVVVGALPEISTSIVGSINQIDTNRVKELMTANAGNKLLYAILAAILSTAAIRDVVDLGNLAEVKIDIVLGIPPKISVDLV